MFISIPGVRNRQRAIGIVLSGAIANDRADEDVGDAPVLCDGRAPVDRLLDPTVGQRYVIKQATRQNASATA